MPKKSNSVSKNHSANESTSAQKKRELKFYVLAKPEISEDALALLALIFNDIQIHNKNQ